MKLVLLENKITVQPFLNAINKTIVVESDWSSASYFYSLIALSEIGSEVTLSAYKKDSLQGDSCLAEIYQHFGVETTFEENTITITKKKSNSKSVNLRFKKCSRYCTNNSCYLFWIRN